MTETGLIDFWRKKYSPSIRAEKCRKVDSGGHRNLKLIDLQSAFLIWLIGHIFAIIAFVLEVSFYYCRKLKHKIGFLQL